MKDFYREHSSTIFFVFYSSFTTTEAAIQDRGLYSVSSVLCAGSTPWALYHNVKFRHVPQAIVPPRQLMFCVMSCKVAGNISLFLGVCSFLLDPSRGVHDFTHRHELDQYMGRLLAMGCLISEWVSGISRRSICPTPPCCTVNVLRMLTQTVFIPVVLSLCE